MAGVNTASIIPAFDKYVKSSAGKAKLNESIKTLSKNGNITPQVDMDLAAQTMIEILQRNAGSVLPPSVRAHYDTLSYTLIPSDKTPMAEINFGGEVSRLSLLIASGSRKGQRTGDGIDNIVALFDNGYTCSKQVFGIWEGHAENRVIGSLTQRIGRHIVKGSVDEFNAIYAGKGVMAYSSNIYE